MYFWIYTVLLNMALSEAFFFWKEKPIFFCFKVCPLYCSKDSQRRLDVDSSSTMFIEDGFPRYEPEFWVEDIPYPPYYYGHWAHKVTKKPKPKPTTTTTTTEAPTTPEPTYICIVCEKKCGYKS